MAAQTDLALVDSAWLEHDSAGLAYRLDVRASAMELLQLADVPLPFGLTCDQWNEAVMRLTPAHLSWKTLGEMFMQLGEAEVLGGADYGQGHSWTYPPLHYVAAALGVVEYDDEEKARKIEILKDAGNERTKELAEKMRRNHVVRDAARQLADALGGKVRDLLPSC